MINPRIHGYGQFRKTIKNYSYFLNDKIGHGYSSTVYKGINDTTNEKVAIKVIQLKFIKDQHTHKLLQTQLECIKKINHRYLLKFIDTYETTNNLYIITQYCEGGDLQKQLNTKGRFTQNQLIKFYAQFYQGYVNLMEAGFIHRDIKPANILIKNGKIRIADFGIVKKANQNPKDSYTVGTIVYMAPESLALGIVTEKSDVWAIGIMLYQLTHGHLPWKNSGNDKKLLKLQIQNIVFTFDSNWLSIECIKFISRCLDKDSSTRISIKEMLHHPWMIPVVKLINESKLKNSRKKKTNVQNTVKSQQNSQSNISIKNVPNLFHNPNSATNITVNGKIHSQNESPHKVPLLKFIYKNGNEAINVINDNHEPKQQMASQSPFHRMRIKITGINHPYPSSMPLIPKPPQHQNKQKYKSIQHYLFSVLNYMRYVYKSIKNIHNCNLSLIPQQIQQKILTILIQQLVINIINKQRIIKDGENIYRLSGWQQYRQSNKYEKYIQILQTYITKYCNKYTKQYHNMKNIYKNRLQNIRLQFDRQIQQIIIILLQIIKMHINTININNNNNMDMSIFDSIRLADNLISIYHIHYGIFNHLQQYTKQVLQIQPLLFGWQAVNYNNYQEKWNLLQIKGQLIFQH